MRRERPIDAVEDLHETVEDPHAALRTLTSFAVSLLQQNELGDLLWDLAENAGRLLGFEDCVVYLCEPNGVMQYAACGIKNPQPRRVLNPLVIPYGHGIVGTVAVSGRYERVRDTSQDPRYIPDEVHGKSELTVPLVFEGRIIGVLDSERPHVDGFSEADEALFAAVATLAAPRIASALAQRGRDEAETALEEANKAHRLSQETQREQRMESLGQLAGGIAHDFNNFLTAIMGNVSLARSYQSPSEVSHLLEEAENACGQARSLTKQLLTHARGGMPVKETKHVGALVKESVIFALRGSGVAPIFDLEEPLFASMDSGQISQIFTNLTINAVQAMQNKGTLRVSARRKSEAASPIIEIRFRDEGHGVRQEDRHRIFEPYFSTRSDGSGLGLSTAYWIARRHGGALFLDAEPTKGSCFVIQLPATSQRTEGDSGRSLSQPPDVAACRILVMEDDAIVRRTLIAMLKKLGHFVEATIDGEECIARYVEALTAHKFDLVLMDLTIAGGMGGRETIQKLLNVDPSLLAIVASGYCDDPVLANYESHGFHGRLEKPFDLHSLDKEVRRVLHARA